MAMVSASDCPLVIISWVDSVQAAGSWQFLADYEKQKPFSVTSVGWLIQDDDECKVLAQSIAHVDEDGVQSAGRKVIPTRCVVKVERLAEVPAREQSRLEVAKCGLKCAVGNMKEAAE